jgi:DNA repair protein RadA/Sms
VEEVIRHETEESGWKKLARDPYAGKPKPILEITYDEEQRKNTFDNELNRVLGGGLVPGSVILIGGEPGIGKSTLMLQLALNMKGTRVLYVSGEESEQQIRMRAERLGVHNEDCFILTETSTENIFNQISQVNPELLVVDSIQTLYTGVIESSAGSVSQIRECAAELLKFSKATGIPVFLVGHITKDGNLAGPKLLEHMVDTVLQFEGDRNYGYRILRSVKNRFGSTSELGIYEMQYQGLREISNPSEILISHSDDDLSGVSIGSTLEGLRPLLIEVQALVSTAAYGTPQRSSTGYDGKRLNMLLAVLEKRGGFRLGTKDVFVNIAGGLRVDDPALDLAVVAAIISSMQDIPVHRKSCFAAEIGLSGEIRPVSRIEQRILEAEKLGYGLIFISKNNLRAAELQKLKIRVKGVSKIEEVVSALFES